MILNAYQLIRKIEFYNREMLYINITFKNKAIKCYFSMKILKSKIYNKISILTIE